MGKFLQIHRTVQHNSQSGRRRRNQKTNKQKTDPKRRLYRPVCTSMDKLHGCPCLCILHSTAVMKFMKCMWTLCPPPLPPSLPPQKRGKRQKLKWGGGGVGGGVVDRVVVGWGWGWGWGLAVEVFYCDWKF